MRFLARRYFAKSNGLQHDIAVALGGRAAEEIVFKEINRRRLHDLSKATQIARGMVCEWGMSEKWAHTLSP